ncbi:MAG: VWA domain-containing protein [Alistipes sp.]|nr:VWA domain-containing protein [Alistipes sp.]
MYTQSITHNHRTAFILLIDASGSMSEPIDFRGQSMTKAAAVAAVTNELLFELIERARRDDGVRDYYDIAVLSYSGDDEVRSLLPGGRDLLSVRELAGFDCPLHDETTECRLPDGGISLRYSTVPNWIAPRAAGKTPMFGALCKARELAAAWCSRPEHAESFPPVVFNITDGEATDCTHEELLDAARRLQGLGTADGNLLLVNIHIAAHAAAPSIFLPSEEEATALPNRYAELLCNCSSTMPACFDREIRNAKQPAARPPFRGFCYNASATELLTMLNIGSISVKTE